MTGEHCPPNRSYHDIINEQDNLQLGSSNFCDTNGWLCNEWHRSILPVNGGSIQRVISALKKYMVIYIMLS